MSQAAVKLKEPSRLRLNCGAAHWAPGVLWAAASDICASEAASTQSWVAPPTAPPSMDMVCDQSPGLRWGI